MQHFMQRIMGLIFLLIILWLVFSAIADFSQTSAGVRLEGGQAVVPLGETAKFAEIPRGAQSLVAEVTIKSHRADPKGIFVIETVYTGGAIMPKGYDVESTHTLKVVGIGGPVEFSMVNQSGILYVSIPRGWKMVEPGNYR